VRGSPISGSPSQKTLSICSKQIFRIRDKQLRLWNETLRISDKQLRCTKQIFRIKDK
jgi:hypothetical protein